MTGPPGVGYLAARRTTRPAARLLERAIFADTSVATKERIDHALAIARQSGVGTVMREIARAAPESASLIFSLIHVRASASTSE